mmetsp:Transcript_33671/g.96746  ORF Transcript_33671/g.96746 Transcript_33671/m.96746 type:complete len:330 (-) Transcript_33671:34-1023(-)
MSRLGCVHRLETVGLVVPLEVVQRTHVWDLGKAHDLLFVAVTEVCAQQLEVTGIHLLDQRLGLRIQVTSPRVVTAPNMYDPARLDAEPVGVLLQDFVHGAWEAPVVDGQLNAIVAVKVFRLGYERAIVQEGVLSRKHLFHHLLDSPVHIALVPKLGVRASVTVHAAAKEGGQPLIGIAQQTEDGLVAKVFLGQVLRPVLLRREVHGASSYLADHAQVGIEVAPRHCVWPHHLRYGHEGLGNGLPGTVVPLGTPAHALLGAWHEREERGRLHSVPEVEGDVHQHEVIALGPPVLLRPSRGPRRGCRPQRSALAPERGGREQRQAERHAAG